MRSAGRGVAVKCGEGVEHEPGPGSVSRQVQVHAAAAVGEAAGDAEQSEP